MRDFKTNIAIAFLTGFIFPQVLSSMHYLLVSHSFYSESNITFKEADLPYQLHTCHYHLHSSSSVLPSEIGLKNVDFVTPPATLIFFSLEDYVHKADFNFQLRGPPL